MDSLHTYMKANEIFQCITIMVSHLDFVHRSVISLVVAFLVARPPPQCSHCMTVEHQRKMAAEKGQCFVILQTNINTTSVLDRVAENSLPYGTVAAGNVWV